MDCIDTCSHVCMSVFFKQKNKQEVVTAFSGLLELSRRNKVQTSQDEIFGDIVVERKANKA